MQLLMRIGVYTVMFFALRPAVADVAQETRGLIPVPQKVTWGDGVASLDHGIKVTGAITHTPRMTRAADRLLDRLHQITGVPMDRWQVEDLKPLELIVNCAGQGQPVQGVDEDESYRLTINEDGVRVFAETEIGALRAMATIEQLAEMGHDGFVLPYVEIKDTPRFPWRGILIDV